MNLLKIYNEVDEVLETLDFHALFAGFRKYRYAIYNSSEICINGNIMPYQEEFRGNTAIGYHGEYIAIWNMELDPVDDMEMLAYKIVHEMFHCHQMANGEKRYPSDLVLLNYPSDINNFEEKYNENLYLAEAYEKHDLRALQKFAHIRSMRMMAYPDMVRQELKVETVEGTAEYVGLKALQVINRKKFPDVLNNYISILRKQDGLLFDIRRISYYSGALYCLCCNDSNMILHNDFSDEQTIYEQNPVAFDNTLVEIKHYDFIADRYAEITREREELITACIEKWEYTACNAFICGYDPMNMFRVGAFIYCKYFICLNVNGVVENINSSVVLQLDKHSDQNIVGYYSA